jgi:uncharacterized ferritin-like protein (DUF455 family)
MEIRAHALEVVTTSDLTTKLAPLPAAGAELTDAEPGPALRLEAPGRPPGLEISPGRKVRVPSLEGFADPAQRRRILHALANHELQAAELFAWALLAFPDAHPEFRRGLVSILEDEKRHTRMYAARVEALGGAFGDGAVPVSGYFWGKVESIRSPLDFVAAMSLTFENANLDHTDSTARAAREAGDDKTARVIERVGEDEVEHVRFGWTWLERLRGEREAWDAYRESLTWPLRPAKARGEVFRRDRRQSAGLAREFIDRLEAAVEDDG